MAAAYAIAKVFGKRLIVFKSDHPAGQRIAGFASESGKILINAEGPRPHFAVVGHELIHRMRSEHPDLYDGLVKGLDPLLKTNWAKGVWEGYHATVIKEEFIANFAGDNIMNPKVLLRLAEQVPGIGGKVAKFVLANVEPLIRDLRKMGWGSSKWVNELETARTELANALSEYAKRNSVDSRGKSGEGSTGLGPDHEASLPPKGESTSALNAPGPSPSDIADLHRAGIGISPEGALNASEAAFSVVDLDRWAATFGRSKKAIEIYGKEYIEKFLKSMVHTAAILGHQFPEPMFDKKGKWMNPLRKNSDPLFKDTFDLSTICPQQDLYLSTLRALEMANGSIYSPQQRFLIGEMMKDMGMTPACFYCYGQAGRNVFDAKLAEVSKVFNRVADKYKNGEVASDKDIAAEFGKWTTVKNVKDPETGKILSQKASFLMDIIREHASEAGKSGFRLDELRLRDVIDGKIKPGNEFERSLADGLQKWAQAASLRNAPKGFAPYVDQMLRKAMEKIEKANRAAGQRINSQTDLRPWHVIDLAQFLAHLAMRKGMAHVYSREPAMVEIFGDTGLKVNMSCEYAHNPDGSTMVDERGTPMWNGMNGMSLENGLKFRKRYKDTGSMLVAFTKQDLSLALADKNIDMVIPYHAGGVPKWVNKFFGAEDFSKDQHEKFPKGWKKKEGRSPLKRGV